MKHPFRLFILLSLLLSLLFSAAAADTEKDGFHFDDNGFLTGDDNPADEYILENEEKGIWQYASRDLAITVTRTREKGKNKKILEYCIAEIRCTENSRMGSIMTEPYSRYGSTPTPGVRQEVPTTLIAQNPSILAVSDDMYGLRLSPVSRTQTKYDYHGVIIRNGEVLATKTRKSPEEGKKDKRPWPNLDTIAVYQDGSMKTFVSGDKTAEEYLADGAVDVLAFGPWLISGGEMNPALQNKNYYPASEPRVAIGMAEPYHYIIIAAAGRPKEKYTGVKLLWLAEKLQEYGCTEALNLDGGATVVMAFNNKVILQGEYSKKARNVGSMIAFGIREDPE
ncbi:MAG: phosphodiester glycosidase family protein [Clostridiales bacterium]|nr:phosphodiester glycosidase family protein [Clostridiales bacterium]